MFVPKKNIYMAKLAWQRQIN